MRIFECIDNKLCKPLSLSSLRVLVGFRKDVSRNDKFKR
jgi:hypothetical protein